MMPTKALGAGEVGYVITGAKDVSQSKVGDTITSAINPATEPLEGYRDPQPMVYAGLFPIDNAQYPELREALDKLKLNDAASSTNRKPPWRWASASVAASWAYCTWRSSPTFEPRIRP